jgi:replicative DNA helicase
MGLIACAFVAPNLWAEMADTRAEDFTDPWNARIWQAISDCYLRGETPNPRRIVEFVSGQCDESKRVLDMLIGWIAAIVSPLAGRDYAREVQELSDRRRIVAQSEKLLASARDIASGGAADILGRGIADLAAIVSRRSSTISAFEVGMEIVNSLDKFMQYNQTKFPRLDAALGGGFYQNKFYGLGARMKAGKSLMLATIAYNMTMLGSSKVLYLCLEMGYAETFQRLLARKMGLNARDFLNPHIRMQEGFQRRAREATAGFRDCGLFFQARPRIDLDDLRSIIAQQGINGKIDGIIIDYVQLVTGKKNNQSLAEHYDHVAQTMAEAVKRFPIWILTAAQLNQEGNIRGGEGLLNACDLTFAMHKTEFAPEISGRRPADEAWLEMLASRYTPYYNIGSENSSGYRMETQIGPMFCEKETETVKAPLENMW